jgi:hypothetical protein
MVKQFLFAASLAAALSVRSDVVSSDVSNECVLEFSLRTFDNAVQSASLEARYRSIDTGVSASGLLSTPYKTFMIIFR